MSQLAPNASNLFVEMSEPRRFTRAPLKKPPSGGGGRGEEEEPARYLYIANCGPAVGVSDCDVASAFAAFGEVVGVQAADDSGTRVIVCYAEAESARAAMEAWGGGRPCAVLGGRVLHIRYSVLSAPRKMHVNESLSVSLEAADLGIPGIYMLRDFLTVKEEQELLAAVDSRPWKSLAKRRVQHYGYEFLYETRNVDSKQFLGELPLFVSPILEKLSLFPIISDSKGNTADQLTVNEYRAGVGLAPHIDTHSAFGEHIFSLSLAGSCIMEFRKYSQTAGPQASAVTTDLCSNVERRAIFLPPRSMLLMSGEGRYAWNHYIPHHKVDMVGGREIKRGSRRVSFTFRKIRDGPCCCEYAQLCDTQMEKLRTGRENGSQ